MKQALSAFAVPSREDAAHAVIELFEKEESYSDSSESDGEQCSTRGCPEAPDAGLAAKTQPAHADGAAVGALVQRGLLGAETADAAAIAFFKAFVLRTYCGGVAHMAFLPVAFWLAAHGRQRWAPVLLLLQGLAGACIQARLAHMLESFFSGCAALTAEEAERIRAVRRAYHGPYVGACGCACVFVRAWILKLALALPESLDISLDGITAGGTGSTAFLSEEAARAFERSWRGVPGPVGRGIADIGLAGALKCVLVFAVGVQVIALHISAARARSNCSVDLLRRDKDGKRGDLIWVLNLILRCSEDGSLSFMSVMVCRVKGALGDGRVPQSKLNRKVVAEALPTLWFSESLLGLALHFDDEPTMGHYLTFASICTSILAAGRLMAEYVNNPDVKWDPVGWSLSVGLPAFSAVSLLVLVVRLIGIWTCPEHNFSVRPMAFGCDEW